jgi:hypothetical protein
MGSWMQFFLSVQSKQTKDLPKMNHFYQRRIDVRNGSIAAPQTFLSPNNPCLDSRLNCNSQIEFLQGPSETSLDFI